MRILLTADPMIPVPPVHYGGIERIIDMLVTGYIARGHNVLLMGHPESAPRCEVRAWPGLDVRGRLDTLRNVLALRSAVKDFQPDVVHSFGRLAYMMGVLRQPIPKIMSYQREPSLGQIKKAVRLARPGTLTFTGCAEHIAAKIQPIASSVPVFAWDREGVWEDPEYYPDRVEYSPVSSVPYWSDACGMKFRDLEEGIEKWGRFWERVNSLGELDKFDPRGFILSNLTLEKAATAYLSHVHDVIDSL